MCPYDRIVGYVVTRKRKYRKKSVTRRNLEIITGIIRNGARSVEDHEERD